MCVSESSMQLEPGTTRIGRETRFRLPAFQQELQLAAESRQSISLDASAALTKDIYHKGDKQMTIHTLPIPKPGTKLSLSTSEHVNHFQEFKCVDNLVGADEVWEGAFNEVDKDGEGYIRPKELRMVIRSALGAEPTRQQLRVFDLYLGGGRERRITLGELIAAVPKVSEYMYKEIKAVYPSFVKSSVASAASHRENQENQRRTGILPADFAAAAASGGAGGTGHGDASPTKEKGFRLGGPVPQSSYEMDIGSARDVMGPQGRPVDDPTGRGMYTTTRDLAAGTPKVTQAIACYMGHIPRELMGEAGRQGLRATTRDNTKINLDQTFHRRIVGYAGHLSSNGGPNGSDIRLHEGAGAATDYGRSSYAVASLWGTRLGDPAAFGSTSKR